MAMSLSDTFHGYMGRLVILRGTQCRTAKIVGGKGIELYMQWIDGSVFKCYHDNIEYIWER